MKFLFIFKNKKIFKTKILYIQENPYFLKYSQQPWIFLFSPPAYFLIFSLLIRGNKGGCRCYFLLLRELFKNKGNTKRTYFQKK